MIQRRATCACGRLAVTCQGEAVRISMCHCLSCQLRTGSVFSVQARFPRDKVTVEGQSTSFVRVADSGGRITTHFCPSCGSTVYWELDAVPGHFAVAVGAFADPRFPPPRVSVYGNRRHPWTAVPPDCEQLD